MLLGQMVVKFAADLTNLTAGIRNSQSQMRNFSSTTQSSMSGVAAAQLKAEEAAHKLELAQAQAAQAIKRANDMATSGKASAEQQATANARAALAADKVRSAELNLVSAQERVQTTARDLANAEDHAAQSEEHAASASSSFHGALENMRGGLTSTISKVVEFGAHLVTVVGGIKQVATTLFDWAQAALEPAASMEQVETSLEVFTGSTQKAHKELADLADFASHTPFETRSIDDAALKMQSVGISATDVIPYIKSLGDALDATGHTSSADLDQIVNNFDKIKTEGHLTTEIMNSFADAGVDAWTVLEKQTGKTHEQLAALISNGLYKAKDAMHDLTVGIEANPLYHGQMANDANVFNGAVSTMKSNFNQLLVSFGSPVIKFLEQGIGKLNSVMTDPAVQTFATEIGTNLAGGLQSIGNFVNTTVVPGFQKLSTWAQNVGKAFDTVGFQNLVKSLQDLGGTINTTLMPALTPLGNSLKSTFSDQGASTGAATLANTFQFLANVINGLNTGIKFMSNLWSAQIWPVLQNVGAFLTSTFGPSFAQVGQILQTQLMPQLQQLWTALQPILTLIGGILLVVLGLAVAYFAGLASAIAGALPGIITFFSGLVQYITGIVQIFSGIISFIYDLFTLNFSKLGADLTMIWTGIGNMFNGQMNMIKGFFMAGLGWITGFIGGWISGAIGYFTHLYDVLVGHSIIPDMIRSIISWFAGLPGAVISFVSQLVSRAIGFFGVLAQTAIGKAGELVNGFISRISALPGQAGAQVQNAANSIRNTLSGIAGQALSWGSNLVSSFANGIRNAAGQAGQAAQDVANNVKNFLGIHSPADRGPLSELMEWPVNLVKSYADQMSRNTPLIERAVAGLMEPTTALNGRAAVAVGATGGSANTSSSSAGPGANRGQQTIIIQLDGHEIGRHVSNWQAKELRVQGVIRR